jgi:hypothetical protein
MSDMELSSLLPLSVFELASINASAEVCYFGGVIDFSKLILARLLPTRPMLVRASLDIFLMVEFILLKAITAGMAATRPMAVADRASAIPGATTERVVSPEGGDTDKAIHDAPNSAK